MHNSILFCCMDLIRKSIRAQIIYRSNIVMNIISGFLLLVVQASVWQALFQHCSYQGTTLSQSITYTILSTVLLQKMQINPGQSIGQSVYSGDLGSNMLRPMNLLLLSTCNEAGKMIFSLLTYTIPTMIIANVIYGILPPIGIGAFVSFLISACFGLILFTLFDSIVGYSAFWLLNNWYMPWFESALLALFGGTIVPFWFYPQWLICITKFLPFQYFFAIPINFYLGKLSESYIWQIAGMQLMWIALFWGIERLVWHAAQNKIMIQGG